ncbi:MAG TPA: alpha/beta fold hydrolase [Bacteroidales bacterium]|nr:alpha/beta fold hydrolase [Bacteroidales bacterium]
MKLFYRKFGHGCPLIILHGLYGSSDNWVSFARSLSGHFKVYIPDQRNHGQSPNHSHHSYEDLRDDLSEFIHEHSIINPVLIGHSMGGKTAMFFASRYPELIRALIVIDISPGKYNEDEEENTRFLKHRDILRILSELPVEDFKSREDADKALHQYIRIERIRNFLLKNLTRDENGGFRWKLNLPVLRSNLDHIMAGLENEQFLHPDYPVLFVKGELSDYISEKDVRIITTLFPAAQIKTIHGAGHWIHAEKPDELFTTIYEFLKNNHLCD